MKNPTFPNNENEIPNIFFNQVRDHTLSSMELLREKKSAPMLNFPIKAVSVHPFPPNRFYDTLKVCGVDLIEL